MMCVTDSEYLYQTYLCICAYGSVCVCKQTYIYTHLHPFIKSKVKQPKGEAKGGGDDVRMGGWRWLALGNLLLLLLIIRLLYV